MWKNVCNVTSDSSFWKGKENKEWSASLYWTLAAAECEEFSAGHFEEERPLSNELSLLKWVLHKYKMEAEEGISQIQDPLWRRVCLDVLGVLGPIAFKDLWKIKLTSISLERRRAYLVCPTQAIADTIENYHFVIIDALKKFYPSLFSIETEISGNEINETKEPKVGVSLYHHLL